MSASFQHFARSRPAGPEQGPSPAAALHVEVIADLVCPFCYIGKRRLDQALLAVQGPSDVSWYPYQLNPDMPPGGADRRAYLETKFGGKENAVKIYARIAEAAARAGAISIDAPVSGGDVGAREARLSIMIGGDKKAVEALFDTKVEGVRVARVHGKVKRQGRYSGQRPDWKKAWVVLKKDAKMIEFFEVA